MLQTIDLKAPPRDDLPFEEVTHLVGTNPALRGTVGQTEAIGHPYGRYVPSFPEIVSRPVEPTMPATSYPRAAPLAECAAVLVADDFEANRRTVARNLKMQGHAVTTAENGRQALALLRERLFDLVLLDIMMPEMDGYQVLEQIRADPRLRHIPVVVISAIEEMSSIVRCIELGAADYLFKPFDPMLLNARVSACLENKRLRDQEQALLRQIQAEQARSERLLLNILPRPIAERLKQGQHRIAQYVDGVIGQKKFTYDLWGDTVNIASRMESLGQAGRIHISAATQRRLGNRYYF